MWWQKRESNEFQNLIRFDKIPRLDRITKSEKIPRFDKNFWRRWRPQCSALLRWEVTWVIGVWLRLVSGSLKISRTRSPKVLGTRTLKAPIGSSPAMMVHYIKKRLHVFTLTVLKKTPSECTCPRREVRGSQGPTKGWATRARRMWERCHLHPLRAVYLGELRLPPRLLQ